MKRIFLLTLLVSLFFSYASAQPGGDESVVFTPEEIARANTAKDCTYLSTLEKNAIYYLNLARTCPKKFAEDDPLFGNK